MSIKQWFKDAFPVMRHDDIDELFERMRRNELVMDRIRTEQVRLGRKAKGSPYACQRCFGTGVVVKGTMPKAGGQINLFYRPCPAQCPPKAGVQNYLGENDDDH